MNSYGGNGSRSSQASRWYILYVDMYFLQIHCKQGNEYKCELRIWTFHSDIDECKEEMNCDVNAFCINTDGSFLCHCSEGYTGNGDTCSKLSISLHIMVFVQSLITPLVSTTHNAQNIMCANVANQQMQCLPVRCSPAKLFRMLTTFVHQCTHVCTIGVLFKYGSQ